MDADGRVANFVETEQIVTFGGRTVSHVQIRGEQGLLNRFTSYRLNPTVLVASGQLEQLPSTPGAAALTWDGRRTSQAC
jgi:hypothetical protein